MPSLHFGYSSIIGITVASVPIRGDKLFYGLPKRLFFLAVGALYPALILVAIIATANHFILDAFVGLCISVIGLKYNRLLLNLLPVEDYVLYASKLHKPLGKDEEEDSSDFWIDEKGGRPCLSLQRSVV
jgi:hypothetical protein